MQIGLADSSPPSLLSVLPFTPFRISRRKPLMSSLLPLSFFPHCSRAKPVQNPSFRPSRNERTEAVDRPSLEYRLAKRPYRTTPRRLGFERFDRRFE